jgi:hypothetical protein
MKPTRTASIAATETLHTVDDVDLATLPKRIDRRAGAELVTRFFFPVSYRTVEAWPLVTKLVNGKAIVDTRELLAYAKAKFDAAPPIRGGRRSSTTGS